MCCDKFTHLLTSGTAESIVQWVPIMPELKQARQCGFVVERFRQSPYCIDVAGSNLARGRADKIQKRPQLVPTSIWIFSHRITYVSKYSGWGAAINLLTTLSWLYRTINTTSYTEFKVIQWFQDYWWKRPWTLTTLFSTKYRKNVQFTTTWSIWLIVRSQSKCNLPTVIQLSVKDVTAYKESEHF